MDSDDLPILHLDSELVVLDKPAGLLSVPGIGPMNADCLASRVQAVLPDARIVHRLDQATSGVVVMARGAAIHRELSRQFEQREVEKRYIAIVAGIVDADEGEIDLPMRKDMERTARHIVDHERGRPALTRWRVVERDAARARTRLELRPLTGRSHQLRVHLAAIGHPIVGDEFYAGEAVARAAPRLLLHATALTITMAPDARGATIRRTFASPAPFEGCAERASPAPPRLAT